MGPVFFSLWGAFYGFVICDHALGLVEKIGPIGGYQLDFYYGFYTFLMRRDSLIILLNYDFPSIKLFTFGNLSGA